MNHDERTEDFLAHFGVKGMKWGVRNDDKPSGRSTSAKKDEPPKHKPASRGEHIAAAKKTYDEAKPSIKNYQESKEKSLAKLEPSDGKGGLSPERKAQIKKAALAAAVIGVAAGAAYYGNKKFGSGKKSDFSGLTLAEQTQKNPLFGMAGKKVTIDQYDEAVSYSRNNTWLKGQHLDENTFKREGFELPAGHQFYRLSSGPESEFRRGTYATHTKADADRYINNFRYELPPGSLHQITFKATKPIKVASAMDAVEILREEMTKSTGKQASVLEAQKVYNTWAGSEWNNRGTDPFMERFINTLTGRGYGALLDEMDVGVVGESPLVIFSRDVTQKVSEKLSDGALAASLDRLTEIPNRRP